MITKFNTIAMHKRKIKQSLITLLHISTSICDHANTTKTSLIILKNHYKLKKNIYEHSALYIQDFKCTS